MTGNDVGFWQGAEATGGQGAMPVGSGKRRPLEAGYIHVPEDSAAPLQLIASYSEAADTYYFPRRYRCPRTEGSVEDRLLSPVGTIYSFTYVHFASMGTVKYANNDGYGVAQIDFPEGPRVQGIIHGQLGDWEIGDKVRIAFHPITVDEDGTELCTYAFEVEKEGGQ